MLMTQTSLVLTGSRAVGAKGKVSGRVFNMGRRGLFLVEGDEPFLMRMKAGDSGETEQDRMRSQTMLSTGAQSGR